MNQLRGYTAKVRSDGAISFIASTAGVKRDGQEIRQDRWLLDNYRKNPVVLWAHSYGGQYLPIGKAVKVGVERGALLADIVFDPGDSFAQQVKRKYESGFLNAVSVGWNNILRGADTWHELLDISAVPVPGDPEAVKRMFELLKRRDGGQAAPVGDISQEIREMIVLVKRIELQLNIEAFQEDLRRAYYLATGKRLK